MDTLSAVPAIPVAVGVLNTPRPVIQPVAGGLAQNLASSRVPAPPIQELAQSLFQQVLQSATQGPMADPASGSAGLAQDAIASLLAALNPVQAPADTTPPATATTKPEVIQNLGAAASVISSSNLPASVTPAASLQDLPATQDGFGTSLNPDFAMQTALRFGAGVTIQAAAAEILGSHPGTGLVRDATSVLRLGNLQPQTGHPGPGAFAQSHSETQRILHTYGTDAAAGAIQDTSAVDLLA